MQPKNFHILEDDLERLAAGQPMTRDELERVATHLLGCGHCQDRFRICEEFVALMRAALLRCGV